MMDSQQARERAEMKFKKKETQRLEAREAMADYNADSVAAREKTARLRALRMARDAVAAPSIKKMQA
ncbi:MAG: hypothetical protein K8F62_02305 [Pseudorhodoplanes sp.]|nr:hypothetical protein [Pseudorhodoplanes sp.]